jgi:hypothetical protein
MPIIKLKSDLADTGTSIAFFENKQMYKNVMRTLNHINLKMIINSDIAGK